MIRGLAVHQRPRPEASVLDHASQGGPVGGGEIRREEAAVGVWGQALSWSLTTPAWARTQPLPD